MVNIRYMDGMGYEINEKSNEIRICLKKTRVEHHVHQTFQ